MGRSMAACGFGGFTGWSGLCTKLSYLASQAACQSVYLPISDKLIHSIFIVRYHIADNFADQCYIFISLIANVLNAFQLKMMLFG